MLPEDRLAEVLRGHPALRDAGEALIAAANEAGGRDNITVVLLRLEELDASASPLTEESAPVPLPGSLPEAHRPRFPPAGSAGHARPAPAESPPTVIPRRPRLPFADAGARTRRRVRLRRAGALAVVLAVLAVLGAGAYVALQSVYFIGTNDRGLVTVFRGVPFRLPGNLALYSSDYVSGVSASTLTAARRRTLLDHSLRSEANAASLLRSLELGQLE